MQTLYVSQQGCYVGLRQEQVVIKKGNVVLQEVQLPLLDQILVFGKSQLTTQLIRACLQRDVPIAYLSRMGYCYGRVTPISRGYRPLMRYQQQLPLVDRLLTARSIVQAKLKNSRVLLMRQQRRRPTDKIADAVKMLGYLIEQTSQAEQIDRLMGLEGAGAASYFSAFGDCLAHPDFIFVGRSRRPPGNPVNAMLSFGYQVLWNHLLTLVELQGLDPYVGCLHQDNERHATLVSDLIEEFRSAIVDSLVLQLVNTKMINAINDFTYQDGGCYLNDSGRRKYLRLFLQRMEEMLQSEDDHQPRWNLLSQQVKCYKQFVYNPSQRYQPYLTR